MGSTRQGRHVVQTHLGDNDADAFPGPPLIAAENLPLLDDIVGQQFRGDAPGIGFGEAPALEAVALGSINRLLFGQALAEQIFHGLHGRGAGIVAHARPEADPDDPIGIDGQRGQGR